MYVKINVPRSTTIRELQWLVDCLRTRGATKGTEVSVYFVANDRVTFTVNESES